MTQPRHLTGIVAAVGLTLIGTTATVGIIGVAWTGRDVPAGLASIAATCASILGVAFVRSLPSNGTAGHAGPAVHTQPFYPPHQ